MEALETDKFLDQARQDAEVSIVLHYMKTHIQVESEDEPEIEGVWGEVEAACSGIPSVDEPRLHHLAHTLFVLRRSL